ncbi:MAG: RNA-guided endonuclease TnpB family protein [Geitlerinemataceae cyanobacterium]
MQHQSTKVRIYPTEAQKVVLSQHFGCARWWWNYALNLNISTYKETGKGLTQVALNKCLPILKKSTETEWLADCYSQVLQSVTLNLVTAYKNFFAGRARYPRFKSKKNRQAIQYSQNVEIVENSLKFPGRFGVVTAKLHRSIKGKIKTVTVSVTPSGKYFVSILTELEGEPPETSTEGKVLGIDLGLTDFAIVNDGQKTSKYANPKHFAKHQRNLARKQAKLARKQKGSKNREKARKLVARVHERVSNTRKDYLHKLSRKLVDDNQVIVVENLNVKGMVRNHKLAKAISDASWGMFVNFLSYKLKREGKILVEIDRWFPSSKTCSNCHYQISKLPLNIRMWDCPSCGTRHDRDENAAINIRAEGIRQLKVSGTGTSANGGDVRPKRGRKSVLRQSPVKLEASAIPLG